MDQTPSGEFIGSPSNARQYPGFTVERYDHLGYYPSATVSFGLPTREKERRRTATCPQLQLPPLPWIKDQLNARQASEYHERALEQAICLNEEYYEREADPKKKIELLFVRAQRSTYDMKKVTEQYLQEGTDKDALASKMKQLFKSAVEAWAKVLTFAEATNLQVAGAKYNAACFCLKYLGNEAFKDVFPSENYHEYSSAAIKALGELAAGEPYAGTGHQIAAALKMVDLYRFGNYAVSADPINMSYYLLIAHSLKSPRAQDILYSKDCRVHVGQYLFRYADSITSLVPQPWNLAEQLLLPISFSQAEKYGNEVIQDIFLVRAEMNLLGRKGDLEQNFNKAYAAADWAMRGANEDKKMDALSLLADYYAMAQDNPLLAIEYCLLAHLGAEDAKAKVEQFVDKHHLVLDACVIDFCKAFAKSPETLTAILMSGQNNSECSDLSETKMHDLNPLAILYVCMKMQRLFPDNQKIHIWNWANTVYTLNDFNWACGPKNAFMDVLQSIDTIVNARSDSGVLKYEVSSMLSRDDCIKARLYLYYAYIMGRPSEIAEAVRTEAKSEAAKFLKEIEQDYYFDGRAQVVRNGLTDAVS